MKFALISLLTVLSFSIVAQSVDHSAWTAILKKNVNTQGMVNYKALAADPTALNAYLAVLSQNEPTKKWTTNEKLSFWINAYNAFTIKLILDYYQGGKLKSIKDIGTIIPIPRINDGWSKAFIKIGTKTLSLNNIEHDIIRKQFAEPRIHVALVCAAKSCPKLRNEAFMPIQLHAQLDDQFYDFVNDPTKNVVRANSATISPIFDWYGSDFTKTKPMADWINKYAKTKMASETKINFGEYNWELNEWK
ncbi:MAG: DUF547 domain-containing protein [Bacteroidota bacterium]